jgi:hypothetical protein
MFAGGKVGRVTPVRAVQFSESTVFAFVTEGGAHGVTRPTNV